MNGVDDGLVDGTQAGTVTASAAGYVTGSATVNVTDNDTAGITVTPIGGLTTTEAGGTATFTVVLTPADGGRDDRAEFRRHDRRHRLARQPDLHRCQLEHAQT